PRQAETARTPGIFRVDERAVGVGVLGEPDHADSTGLPMAASKDRLPPRPRMNDRPRKSANADRAENVETRPGGRGGGGQPRQAGKTEPEPSPARGGGRPEGPLTLEFPPVS